MKNKKYFLIAIILLGIFLRLYKFQELFLYSHDQDLAGWVIRDILSGHFRLIGQETSQGGVFIGPLFYYSLIPFYLLFGMDPIGGVFLPAVIGLASMVSVYWVFKRVFSEQIATISLIIYALNFNIVFTDREVVPTTPVHLWTIWYLYSVYLIFKGKHKYGFILLGFLAGLTWHINLGLIITLPVALLAVFYSKEKLNIKNIVFGILACIPGLLPFVMFEARHNFQQTNAILGSLTQTQSGAMEASDKFNRLVQILSANIGQLSWGPFLSIKFEYTFVIMFIFLVYIFVNKIIDRKKFSLFLVWIVFYVAFFSTNSLILSEYYLNGLTVIWILVFALVLNMFTKKHALIIYLILGLYSILNIGRVLNISVNKSGYIERKAIVRFINEDAKKHGYPCVSVSYITKPGYNLGYRYLFWLEDMHVNNPSSMSPVYTIVFPHSMVDRIDKSFGALGLINPDYEMYNEADVAKSCEGENSNLTDPMFGFLK